MASCCGCFAYPPKRNLHEMNANLLLSSVPQMNSIMWRWCPWKLSCCRIAVIFWTATTHHASGLKKHPDLDVPAENHALSGLLWAALQRSALIRDVTVQQTSLECVLFVLPEFSGPKRCFEDILIARKPPSAPAVSSYAEIAGGTLAF